MSRRLILPEQALAELRHRVEEAEYQYRVLRGSRRCTQYELGYASALSTVVNYLQKQITTERSTE